MHAIKLTSTCLFCGVFLLASVGATASTLDLESRAVAQRAAAARVPFIENDGRIDDQDVLYYARLSSGTLFVTVDGDLVYSLQSGRRERAGWAFRESFVGGKPSLPFGTDPSAIRVHRFEAGESNDRQVQPSTYDRVELGEVGFRLPHDSYFFVIVGDDDSVEGSYGLSSAQTERPASGSCGFIQDLSNPCAQP